MPKRIESEWQALDARIAREVMGWFKWDELPEILRLVFWKAIEEESPDEYDLGYNRERWWSVDESGCPDSEESILEWQPHKDVAQALKALDTVVKRGFDIDLETHHHDPLHSIWIAPAACRPRWVGCHMERPKAACLAIEAWLDAQSLLDRE